MRVPAGLLARAAIAGALLLAVSPVLALDGEVRMHDPSTVVQADGKFYVYGTGNGLPAFVSDDGWTWRRAGQVMQAVPGGKPGPEVLAKGGNNTWAPDIIRSGDRYFLYYSAPGPQPKSAIGLLVGKTLDPASPDYKWEDAGPVVWSDGVEDCNAIDPGVFRDPTNGTLWLTYGSYFGYIRLVELDPRTGKRLRPERKPFDIAINSEASIMIFRDGWYYLLVTHGSCCAGASSTYNIRMGRSRKVTGPFLDNMGIDMLQGGGKLFAGVERPQRRAGAFRPDRPRRRCREVLAPLRSRPRSRRRQRARHPPAALARRLARRRRESHGGHLPDRVGADRYRPRDGGAGRAGRRAATARPRRAWRRGGSAASADPVAGTGARRRWVGELVPWPCEWRRTCCRPSRSGRSRRRRMRAATPGRPTSASRSPARTACWRPPRTRS